MFKFFYLLKLSCHVVALPSNLGRMMSFQADRSHPGYIARVQQLRLRYTVRVAKMYHDMNNLSSTIGLHFVCIFTYPLWF